MNTHTRTRCHEQDGAITVGVLQSVESLLTVHADRIYRFCLGLCGGRTADAEDLAQDVLVLAWQYRDSFDGRSALTTWLMRIALNRHIRLSVRSAAAPASTNAPLNDELAAGGSDPAQQTLDRMEICRALDTLPPHLRAAFLLVKEEGLKYREAAVTLGIPLGTVQSQVHEAVLRLRAALTESAGSEPRAVAADATAQRGGSGNSSGSAPLRKLVSHVL